MAKPFDIVGLKSLIEHSAGHPVCVLDTETTGFSSENDYVVQFSAHKMYMNDNGTLSEEEMPFGNVTDFYIRCPIPMPEAAGAVNGITDDLLEQKGVDIPSALEKIDDFVGDLPVIGQNIPFDIRMLDGMFKREYGSWTGFAPAYTGDTLLMAREKITDYPKEMKPHTLTNLVKLSGNEGKIRNFHNSMADVEATILVWNWLIPMFEEDLERVGMDTGFARDII